MIHLKKAKNGEFYWSSVSKRANGFAQTARSSETYKRRNAALGGFVSHLQSTGLATLDISLRFVDHTRKKLVAIIYDRLTKKISPSPLEQEAVIEANWVANQKD